MKLIIAGSRNIDHFDTEDFYSILYGFGLYKLGKFSFDEIVSGAARGMDTSGEYLAEERGIGLKKFPANWTKNGKAAGIIRNKEMADYADALLVIWDGESRGSKNMKEEMLKRDKPVYEVVLRSYNVN